MEIIDTLKQQWNDAVSTFQQKLSELSGARARLIADQAIAAKDPDDLAEWQSYMSKLDAIQSVIDKANALINTVSGWWGTATGYFGLSGWRRRGMLRVLSGNRSRGLSGLGVLPLIPIGTLLAFIAAVGALAVSIYKFIDYLEIKEQNRYAADVTAAAQQASDSILASGGSPDEANAAASRVVNETASARASAQTGYSIIGDIKTIATYVVLGLIAVQVVPMLIQRGRR